MRYRFTTRRLLIVTVLVAPVLAIIGAHRRAGLRHEKFVQQELERIAAFCECLDYVPEELDSWKLVKSKKKELARSTRFQIVYRHTESSREIAVDVFGGSPVNSPASLATSPTNPFTNPNFEGWIHKESRTDVLSVSGVGPTEARCHDLFAGTLDRTQQNLQLFSHDGKWFADLPTTKQAPFCGVNFKIQPDMHSWSNRMSDPLLIDLAQRFVAGLDETLSSPSTPPRQTNEFQTGTEMQRR